MVEEGGLKVTTSLDLDIQNYAQQAVSDEVDNLPTYYHVTNGAALVTDPGSGEILAMVGSKDYLTMRLTEMLISLYLFANPALQLNRLTMPSGC